VVGLDDAHHPDLAVHHGQLVQVVLVEARPALSGAAWAGGQESSVDSSEPGQ